MTEFLHEPVGGLASIIYLASVTLGLAGFLRWRRVPRVWAFDILHVSAWVYALSFFALIGLTGSMSKDLSDGWLPYLLPLVPVAGVVLWGFRKMRRQKVQLDA